MKDIAGIIGKNLRELRENQGLSKTKLAKYSGVHIAWIGRLENGARETGKIISPSVSTLEKLARGLNVNIQELLKAPDKKTTGGNDKIIIKEIKRLLKKQNNQGKQFLFQVIKKFLK